MSDAFDPAAKTWELEPLAPRIRAIAGGSYKDKKAESIRASGYVVHTLEAALWVFHGSSTFKEGALLAVNLGQDADTNCTVYGQLAGAFYGAVAIPQSRRERLYDGDVITELAVQLHERQSAPS